MGSRHIFQKTGTQSRRAPNYLLAPKRFHERRDIDDVHFIDKKKLSAYHHALDRATVNRHGITCRRRLDNGHMGA